MLTLIAGLIAIAGYAVFSSRYPSPPPEENYEMCEDLVYGQNHIAHNHKTRKHREWVMHSFTCRIQPKKARMSDHQTFLPLWVPDEYIIRHFTVGVNSDNTVEFVWLGDQYHCDNDPQSNCLALQHLYREEFNEEFMEDLMDLISVYDVETSMRHDHWDHEKFRQNNKKIVKATAELIS